MKTIGVATDSHSGITQEEAKKLGMAVLYLEVRESNTPARALYKSLGFEENGIRKNFYEHPVEHAVLMSKTL